MCACGTPSITGTPCLLQHAPENSCCAVAVHCQQTRPTLLCPHGRQLCLVPLKEQSKLAPAEHTGVSRAGSAQEDRGLEEDSESLLGCKEYLLGCRDRSVRLGSGCVVEGVAGSAAPDRFILVQEHADQLSGHPQQSLQGAVLCLLAQQAGAFMGLSAGLQLPTSIAAGLSAALLHVERTPAWYRLSVFVSSTNLYSMASCNNDHLCCAASAASPERRGGSAVPSLRKHCPGPAAPLANMRFCSSCSCTCSSRAHCKPADPNQPGCP